MCALLFLVLISAVPVQSTHWTLSESYVGTAFFSKWAFFSQADPTHGAVEYVDYSQALQEGLIGATADRVFMGASAAAGIPGSRRHSVRIESHRVFNEGLFVVTLDHMPTGCGTWPAFWMFGEDAAHIWPTWGEYDIIEGVHTASRGSTALHTTPGCDQSSVEADWNRGPRKAADNCDVSAPGQHQNQGCSQRGPPDGFGAAFNSRGGGTYAAKWDPVAQEICTWFWPLGAEPADLLAQRPHPDWWDPPFSRFTLEPARCPASHFQNMRLVFDLTFCGDLGNPTYAEACPEEAGRMSCEELVATQAFPEAFWSIRTLDVYQRHEEDGVAWTRIFFALLVLIIMLGAAVLIVRHTRETAHSPGQQYVHAPGPEYRGHRGSTRPQSRPQVNLVREAHEDSVTSSPFKWKELSASPNMPRCAGDELEELSWDGPSGGPLLEPHVPPDIALRESTPRTLRVPFTHVLPQEVLNEELERFNLSAAANSSRLQGHRSPFACGCCRQAQR